MTFLSNVNFDSTKFRKDASFHCTDFEGRVTFQRATFFDRAMFIRTKFKSEAEFVEATFIRAAFFRKTKFEDFAQFLQCSFDSAVYFRESSFKKFAQFRGISGKGLFSLSKVKFSSVPDFTEAHFEEAPRFDDVELKPERFKKSHAHKSKPNLPSRWRALRRLAIQAP